MSNYDEAIESIKASSNESSIYIGCDSQKYSIGKNRFKARYTTVIVIHKDSKHGCQIFHNSIEMEDFGSLKQRLLNEVAYAVEAASAVIDYVGDRNLEIHLDINSDPKHKSQIAMKEAIGYVQGMFGFSPKIKPESWAATHCADHAVRYFN
jgi:hypothetical protein